MERNFQQRKTSLRQVEWNVLFVTPGVKPQYSNKPHLFSLTQHKLIYYRG